MTAAPGTAVDSTLGTDGEVVVILTPAGALAFAEAWEFANTHTPGLAERFPHFFHDCGQLKRAAADAVDDDAIAAISRPALRLVTEAGA